MTWPSHVLLGINTLWLLSPLPPKLLGCDLHFGCACCIKCAST